MRISQDSRLLYANPASQPVLRAWGLEIGQPLPAQWAPSLLFLRWSKKSGTEAILELNAASSRMYSYSPAGVNILGT
jgi:hypothetical protein